MNRALLRVIKDINLGSDLGPWIALVFLDTALHRLLAFFTMGRLLNYIGVKYHL